MKFSEMSYTRPDIDALLGQCKALAAKAAGAASGEELVNVYYEQSRAFADYNTAAQLASIHYTCDTRDAYWKAEQDFFDANGPAVENARVEISRAFLANAHVDALTEAFGTTCVAGMKNAVLGMDDRTVELQKEYNALVSQYQQVYGGALVEFDGKQLTIPQLGPYKENLDPAVRRAAYEAEAAYFDAHRDELDGLYTKIVKNLNAQAQILGYHDYSELSYVRMNRIGYGPEDIKRFRDQVAHDVVPELQKVIALKNKRTGIQHHAAVCAKLIEISRKDRRTNDRHCVLYSPLFFRKITPSVLPEHLFWGRNAGRAWLLLVYMKTRKKSNPEPCFSRKSLKPAPVSIQNPFQNQKRPDRPARFRGTVWPRIQLTGFMLAGSSTAPG